MERLPGGQREERRHQENNKIVLILDVFLKGEI